MFFQRRPGKKSERVFVYVFKDGKQQTIPRALTKHLDGKPDPDIDDWMRWYAAVNNLTSSKVIKADLADLQNLIDKYEVFLKSRNKHSSTVRIHIDRLYDILPFFVKEPDYNQWFRLAGGLHQYMLDKQFEANRHNRCNIAFRGFYRWLQFINLVEHRHDIVLLGKGEGYKETPLKRTVDPEDVLRFVEWCPVFELKLLALTGYFFSLRTYENFALKRESFISGKRAQDYAASVPMRKAGLYDRLVVNITHFKDGAGIEKPCTKKKRGGIVACFNEHAAKLLVSLIKRRKPGHLITQFKPEWWSKRWSKEQDMTLKDLRRASIYWLGHETDLPVAALQNHARHNNITTTMRYVRRPKEEFDNFELDELDLDA